MNDWIGMGILLVGLGAYGFTYSENRTGTSDDRGMKYSRQRDRLVWRARWLVLGAGLALIVIGLVAG